MQEHKLEILALGAHPDDVELGASGTIAKHVAQGDRCGVVDFTKGELGTRGTPELRMVEAENAGSILGLVARENLGLRDGFITNDEESQLKVIEVIRKYRPEILLINAPNDRHPDHGEASRLSVRASFLSGLRNIESRMNGEIQEPWRPKAVYHYIQYYDLEADFIVDITGYMDKKMESIMAYKSQFYDPESKEPKTVISSEGFFKSLESRAEEWGRQIYRKHGEGFIKERRLGVEDLGKLI
jgi:bacillithiol biosynthesis deacetylase BshB1